MEKGHNFSNLANYAYTTSMTAPTELVPGQMHLKRTGLGLTYLLRLRANELSQSNVAESIEQHTYG